MQDIPPVAGLQKVATLEPLEEVLEGLLDEQCVNGNWPVRLGDHEKKELVQFCHGATRFVFFARSA